MNYVNGPRLIRTHKDGDTPGRIYRAGVMETTGEYVIKAYSLAFDAFYYLSPLTSYYLYNYVTIKHSDLVALLPYVWALVALLCVAVGLRGMGRKLDPTYARFSQVYNDFFASSTVSSRRELDRYDFDFSCYPIDFDCIGHTITLEATPNEHAPNCCMSVPVQVFILFGYVLRSMLCIIIYKIVYI